MKCTVLFASPRGEASNTLAVTRPVTDALTQAGWEVERFSLYDMDIQPCRACRGCQSDWEHPACVLRDDMQPIFESVLSADLLLLASPIYSWYCTAPLKAALDRMVYAMNKYYGDQGRGPSLWRGRAVAAVTCRARSARMPSAPQLLARLVPLPRVPRVPMRLPTRAASHVARMSARRVRAVAIPRARNRSPQCPPLPIRSRMVRSRSRAVVPEMAGERLPRLRVAPLATSASRAKIAVARARPTRAKSAVAVAVPASRARMVARARPRLRPHHNRPPANNARERI